MCAVPRAWRNGCGIAGSYFPGSGDDDDEYDIESQMDVDEAPSSSRAVSESMSVSVSLNQSSASTPRPTPLRPSPLKVTLKIGKSRLASSLVASSSSGSVHGAGATPEPDAWLHSKRTGMFLSLFRAEYERHLLNIKIPQPMIWKKTN